MTSCRNNNVSVGQQQSDPLLENLWSTKRLSEFLDVPAMTIKDWCYKRQIPFVKVGRHVRFRPSDVQKWLEERGIYGHPKD